jgi:hypothetical protein
MNLSTELFEQVVASLSPAAEVGSPATAAGPSVQGEQRRDPRVTAGGGSRVRLIPLTDSLAPAPMDVTLRDVAPGGARFLHNSRIPLDEQFVLMLPAADGPVAVLCGVAYWQPVADNVFAIGAKFHRVIRQGNAAATVRPVPGQGVMVRRAV